MAAQRVQEPTTPLTRPGRADTGLSTETGAIATERRVVRLRLPLRLCNLGIDKLPVVDDGTRSVGLDWKVRTATPLVARARSQGRQVYWIEDFHGAYPQFDHSVTYIDTGAERILKWPDLPANLRSI